MKCKVCGAESGKYPLCRVCNAKKEKGEIIKCSVCEKWHSIHSSCSTQSQDSTFCKSEYRYDSKKFLLSNSEQAYYKVISASLPNGFFAFPQVNLASFIVKNDNSPFHNELFRNVDFLVADEKYKPLFIIEINDQTHLNQDRKERDEKVRNICEEAGIPIVNFWTSYGVNEEYISKKIRETLAALPVARVHHFDADGIDKERMLASQDSRSNRDPKRTKEKSGCYVATCIYGSYDCPEVWVLRRYRDTRLASSVCGRMFIKFYYLVSPIAVKLFGNCKWFRAIFKPMLDKMIMRLNLQGVENTPYTDVDW